MTAAPESVTSLGPRGWRSPRPASTVARRLHRWERVLVILGICLPIPVFAATGLSVPLPATVERIAAALAPWAGEANLDDTQSFSLGENGSIVLAPGEVPPTPSAERATTSVAPDPHGGLGEAGSKQRRRRAHRTAAQTGDDTTSPANGGDKTTTTPSGGGGGGGGTDDPSSPATGPVAGAAGAAIDSVKPVVDTIEGTAGDTGVGGVVDGVGGAVEDTADTVDGVVTGIGG